jgi:hypothetical protein
MTAAEIAVHVTKNFCPMPIFAVRNDTYYEHRLMQIIVDNRFKAFE